jgi:hypothetical protein
MVTFVKPMFKKPFNMIGPTFCSTTAGAVKILTNSTAYSTAPSTTVFPNCAMSFTCISGDIHIATLTTAPTAASYKLFSGDSIDLIVPNYLALVSTSTTASFQAVIWEG